MGWKDDFIVFDTETTGISEDARIIELAFARVMQSHTAIKMAVLVNPGPIDWESDQVRKALEVNGLKAPVLKLMPEMRQIIPGLLPMHERVWVGHHIEFDCTMLRQSMPDGQQDFPTPRFCVDTLLCDVGLRPGQHSRKLVSVARAWDVPVNNAHRAMGDVTVTRDVLLKMVPRLPDDDEEMQRWLARSREAWLIMRGEKHRQ